ncbi:MAG: SsrA-binding protein SmpB [Flavobacteriales bacterium]|nr:SsrA-binding protein SmpB [Flavobacteriales bacterium]
MAKEKHKDIRIKNRKASFEYFLETRFTAGIVLTGAEVKSVREGKASISEAYCLFDGGKLIIRGMHIAEFRNAGYAVQQPLRDRDLLLNRSELKKIRAKLKDTGYTIVPVELFLSETGYVKIEIALARGKKLYDKRDDIKKRDQERDLMR